MAQAYVNPEMLIWARERAGLDLYVLAQKLSVRDEKLQSWESGEAHPTFRQAQQLAHRTHIPFGYLFLQQPPADELPLPDLRTVGDHGVQEPSPALKETVREVLQRQLWYRDFQQEREAVPVAAVGAASAAMSVDKVVSDMRMRLEVGSHPERGTADDYFRDLIARIESLGILVMRNSIVGRNTHRHLRVEEFRGFAIADPLAPVIFVNASDVRGAQLFTLIHELTHIWLGQSGISDADPRASNKIEKFCNQVAAEFLVPREELLPLWDEEVSWDANLPVLEAHFHVSQWAIARRAQDLGLVASKAYGEYVRQQLESHRRSKSSGPVPYSRVQKGRISKRFAEAVASEALSGRLLLRDAHRLTGVKPENLAEFVRKELA